MPDFFAMGRLASLRCSCMNNPIPSRITSHRNLLVSREIHMLGAMVSCSTLVFKTCFAFGEWHVDRVNCSGIPVLGERGACFAQNIYICAIARNYQKQNNLAVLN